MTTRVDKDLLRRRRLECGWSQGQLAAHLGTTQQIIRALERGRDADPRLSDLDALATALGLNVADLLTHDPQPATAANQTGDDAAQVGAALAGQPTWTPVAALATVLGWTLQRTLDAVDLLAARLETAGQRLLRSADDRLLIVPAASAAATELRRDSIDDDGLTLTEARVVHDLVHGREVKTTATERMLVLGRLARVGLVSTDVDGTAGTMPVTMSDQLQLAIFGDRRPRPPSDSC